MFDEMYSDDAQIRKHYLQVNSWLRTMSSTVISQKNFEAESHFKRIGITFSVKDNDMTERIIPFDLIPRILTNYEWVKIEKGVLQRAKALNSCAGGYRLLEVKLIAFTTFVRLQKALQAIVGDVTLPLIDAFFLKNFRHIY